MRCEVPLGHADVVRGLWRAAAAGRLPHALLFAGPKGVGKFLAAEWLAIGLFCARGPGDPCGACGPCKRLKADSHPDVFVLDPLALGEEEIKIGRIVHRDQDPSPNVLDFLSLQPMEDGYRVVLVREAERMNASAQSALLKTLEEPGRRTLLVLETSHPASLLPTIHSRCARVALGPLSADETLAVLRREELADGRGPVVDRAHGDGSRAERLARWARGSPGEALRLARSEAGAARELLAGALARRLDPVQAAAELSELGGAGGSSRAADRERARAHLDLALDVVSDLRRAAAGADGELAHGDLREDPEIAARLAGDLGERELARLAEVCLQARQDVEANLAPDALLLHVLLTLSESRALSRPRRSAAQGASGS